MPLSSSRYLVVLLTLVVMVGHLCDLPMEALADWHVHQGGHESTDHHGRDQADEIQSSCDPVDGIRPSGTVRADPGPSVSADRAALASMVVASVIPLPRYDSPGASRRQPLFLLHSSLLI